jgi:hypothetical protein
MNIILPQNAETINKPWVKCCVCNLKTYEGVKQTRMYVLDNGQTVRVNLYMCNKCITKGEAWPGVKPHSHMGNQKIQNELDRFKDNIKVYKG